MGEFQIGDVVRKISGLTFCNNAYTVTVSKIEGDKVYAEETGLWTTAKDLRLVRRVAPTAPPIPEVVLPRPPAHKITIGADPEFFVKLGRTFKSAHGLVAGTKAEPSPLKDGAVQVDGLALEFNIDPCDTAEKFDSCITSVLSQIRDIVPAKYSFEFVPTAKFTPLHMAKQPPEALELGCEPDSMLT